METKAVRNLRHMAIVGYVAGAVFFAIALIDLAFWRDSVTAYASAASVITVVTLGLQSNAKEAIAEARGN